MQAATERAPARRVTAAALRQQIMGYLGEDLPAGWLCQPLAPEAASGPGKGPTADILVISPRGRCHFFFVHAPADRWWDGGPHSVPAEPFPAAQARLARQLRAAGHRARAVWGAKDLARALTAWGCPLTGPVRLGGGEAPPIAAGARPARARLRLKGWERAEDV